MFATIIRFSLRNRMVVLAAAVLLVAYGLYTLTTLPVDVFPDLNQPRVTVMVEVPGLAAEEVETQVTFPLETALNGAPGVIRVRSTSSVGLALVFVEFEWDTDIWRDRQIVQERINQATERLPDGVVPFMAPIASLMGEIMLVGLTSDSIDPMDVRTLADWVIRPQLLALPGIAQVTVMGGNVKQFQVLADPERMRRYGTTFPQLEAAVQASNELRGGGFLYDQNQEYTIRSRGRFRTIEELESPLVVLRDGIPIRLKDVADVRIGAKTKRGDGSVNGQPAVILALQKQPGIDTRHLTKEVDSALQAIQPSLPEGLRIEADLFRQSHFIEAAIGNVEEALRDGAILVAIVLLLFLLNVRTTAITLTAIPLSLLATALTFKFLGMSINTMTLGGIAVAIGELVDDAIVDVENIFRRLRENRQREQPAPTLKVVFDASMEIRSAIVFGTAVVLLVFVPLFALSGLEGRFFRPLAVAYIVSILMSLVVSLTVTPVLSSYLLPKMKRMAHDKDGAVLRFCKTLARGAYRVTFPFPYIVAALGAVAIGWAVHTVMQMGTEFLPPFNEGTATINVLAKPGASLEQSNSLGVRAEELILQIPEVKSTGRRTGRAEQDEHAEGVHYSEIEVDFWTPEKTEALEAQGMSRTLEPPEVIRSKSLILADIRQRLAALPGVSVNIGQPISHRIDHLLSGIRAQVVVKIVGEDLAQLRQLALQVERAMNGLPGVVDLQVEQQTLVPQIRLRVDFDAAARYGFQPGELVGIFETAFKGKVISQVFEGTRTIDLVLWAPEEVRRNLQDIADLRLVSPYGASLLLSDVAAVVETPGLNQIGRENVQRRIAVYCNVQGRDLGRTVRDIQDSIAMDVTLPEGVIITYGGQFESQQRATRLLVILGMFTLVAVFVVLYGHFHSVLLVFQIMLDVPFAFIGGVAALVIAGESLSVASLIGFISLTGIASRNGILMMSHYIHLMAYEGMPFGREMVVRGSLERVSPVLMTALTTSLALIPLVMAKGVAGKEILYPVALVVLGGLATSTLLDIAIRPTLFLRFTGRAGERVARRLAQARVEEDYLA